MPVPSAPPEVSIYPPCESRLDLTSATYVLDIAVPGVTKPDGTRYLKPEYYTANTYVTNSNFLCYRDPQYEDFFSDENSIGYGAQFEYDGCCYGKPDYVDRNIHETTTSFLGNTTGPNDFEHGVAFQPFIISRGGKGKTGTPILLGGAKATILYDPITSTPWNIVGSTSYTVKWHSACIEERVDYQPGCECLQKTSCLSNAFHFVYSVDGVDDDGVLYKDPIKQLVGVEAVWFTKYIVNANVGNNLYSIGHFPIWRQRKKKTKRVVDSDGYHWAYEDEVGEPEGVDGVYQWTPEYGYVCGELDVEPKGDCWFLAGTKLYNIDEWTDSSVAHVHLAKSNKDKVKMLFYGRAGTYVDGVKKVHKSIIVDAAITATKPFREITRSIIAGSPVYYEGGNLAPLDLTNYDYPTKVALGEYYDFYYDSNSIVYGPIPEEYTPESFIIDSCIKEQSDIKAGVIQIRNSNVKVNAQQRGKLVLHSVEGEIISNTSLVVINANVNIEVEGSLFLLNTDADARIVVNGRVVLLNCTFPNYRCTINVNLNPAIQARPVGRRYFDTNYRVIPATGLLKDVVFAPGQPGQVWNGTECTIEVGEEYVELAAFGIPTNGLVNVPEEVVPVGVNKSLQITKDHLYGKLFSLPSSSTAVGNNATSIGSYTGFTDTLKPCKADK